MNGNSSVIDNSKLSKFHLKTTVAGSAGQFCDGYLLGIIAPALPLFLVQHPMSATMVGLVGASTLIGVFLGAMLFGHLTDKYGRRKLFILDLLLIIILSLMHFAVADAMQLLVLRLLIGIAIGGDYSISPTLIAEFSPAKQRAILVSLGPTMWTLGYVAAFFTGAAFANLGEEGWKLMLASSAIPAFLVLFLRMSTPESPRWLASQGRFDEALAILRKYVNPNATLKDLEGDRAVVKNSISEIFSVRYRKRVMFMSVMWICQVIPYFAVFTFLPTILKNLALGSETYETLLINTFLLIGSVLGLYIVNKLSRRTFTILSFVFLTLSTLGIALSSGSSITFIIICFSTFALISAASAVLDVVYPTELFPTEIRATATGICVSASRIGAAIGTFLMPIGMTYWGTNSIILVAAAVCAIGLLVSILYAPETKGLSLTEAAAAEN